MSQVIFEENSIKKLLKQLSLLLTGKDHHGSAIRVHNKQLQQLGDLSFQINLEFAAWKNLKPENEHKSCKTIFEYASKIHSKEITVETISKLTEDDNWNLKISKCAIIKTNCHIFLNRAYCVKSIITNILNVENYGCYKIENNVSIELANYIKQDLTGNMDVSDLRVKILHDILKNFLPLNSKSSNTNIVLTNKSSDISQNKIVCGCVLNSNGQKEETLTLNDIYEEYASNMRMMFEHKLGVRNITESINWKERVRKLGHAAVTFQMIQNSPQKPISVASKHHVIKDAAFVLYNGARIKSILRRFDVEFQDKMPLPDMNSIDFSTLMLNEEWELIYVFLAQFPSVVESSVNSISESKLNLHKIYEFLIHFSTAFSTYYSRIKIITEPRPHMLPTLYARIYLLLSIDRMLYNALSLLNIEVLSQM